MRDMTLGISLFVLGVIAMIGYFWLVFLADLMFPDFSFLGKTIGEWAIVIPVLVIVYLFLFIVVWMGWTMATTPPAIGTTKEDQKKPDATA